MDLVEEGESGLLPHTEPAVPQRHVSAIALCSIVVCTLLICGAIVFFRRVVPEMGGTPEARNEQLILAEAERLQDEGMTAYRAWAKARREGNLALEKENHGEALEKLQAALDTLDRLMDGYRDDEGFILLEYEGYERQMARIAIHLADLQREGRFWSTAPDED